jgi:hypothetical protein
MEEGRWKIVTVRISLCGVVLIHDDAYRGRPIEHTECHSRCCYILESCLFTTLLFTLRRPC